MTRTGTSTAEGAGANEDRQAEILGQIRRSGETARRRRQEIRRRRFLLVTGHLTANFMAATLAAGAAGFAPGLVEQGRVTWPVICSTVAVFSAAALLFSGLLEKLDFAGRASRAAECAAKLSALEIALTVAARDPAEVARDFEQIVDGYADYCL